MDILNKQSSAFKFEKDVLLRCKNSKLSKVSLILDEFEEHIPDFTIPGGPYLIFEMAEGDLREHINFTKDVEIHWKLKFHFSRHSTIYFIGWKVFEWNDRIVFGWVLPSLNNSALFRFVLRLIAKIFSTAQNNCVPLHYL